MLFEWPSQRKAVLHGSAASYERISFHIVRAYFGFDVSGDRMMEHVLLKRCSSTQSHHECCTSPAICALPATFLHLPRQSPLLPPKFWTFILPTCCFICSLCCCEMCVIPWAAFLSLDRCRPTPTRSWLALLWWETAVKVPLHKWRHALWTREPKSPILIRFSSKPSKQNNVMSLLRGWSDMSLTSNQIKCRFLPESLGFLRLKPLFSICVHVSCGSGS